ncbi:MAG: 3-deoxy-8-phosphooctulonate synthase [Ahniella sp.]|nr:3-deoxy-8-phosphooctulonate synthase [Ahniella sp.]
MSKSRDLILDPSASSAVDELPAFLARPDDAPVYHGFALLDLPAIDGWRFGEITAFLGNEAGDAFVIAPDGSRAGLAWEVGPGTFEVISEPEPMRWGVYAIWFPEPNDSIEALQRNLLAVLPSLVATYQRIRSAEG